VVIPVQIFVGDAHGLNTLEHQPAKIAAMEGVWNTERGAPLLLFAIPDKAEHVNHFEVKVPRVASLILTHRLDGEIKGMNEFGDAYPPPLPLFFAFRIMVGMGMLMLATSWVGWWLYRRTKWQPAAMPRPMLWLFSAMTFAGWVATVAGWYVTEIGRQPFIVYGLLRTAEVASKTVTSPMIGLSLALISMATPWISETVRERWFALPEIIALMAIPLTTGAALLAVRGLLHSKEVRGTICWLPFVLLIAVFVLGFLGLAYSIYPYVVIGQMTIWQASSSPEALKVILFGTCISVPAIAGYTVFSYRVFRGKTGELKYA
jgi:hypothetical protein